MTSCQGWPAAGGRWRGKDGTRSPQSLQKETNLPTPLILDPALQNVRELISVVLSHQVCGDSLWQPQETKTTIFSAP